MAVDFVKERSIKYFNKDFQGFKRDLIKFSQAHFSGSLQDYNESSPTMALIELVAYVGDVLSFYQDMQFEELKQESARQIKNVVAIAKQLGYKPAGKRAARGKQTFFIEVPATTLGKEVVPDPLYLPKLAKGAKVQGPNGVVFETLDVVDFNVSTTDYPVASVGSQFDNATGMPTFFAVKKDVEITAGETITESFSIGDFQQFFTLELTSADVIEVLNVTDSDGNSWYEVDYLAQELIFDENLNQTDDNSNVPYVLKLIPAPRRFITDRDPETEKTKLIFGSGDGINFDDELVPNLSDLALPLPGRRTFTTFSLDPQNILKTATLGMSPSNTTLTISYRVGGGSQTNIPPGSITAINEAVLDFGSTNLNAIKKSSVESSLEAINVSSTEGGGDAETISEIKSNSSAFFATQSRAVTKEDFMARVLTLPAKFGKPEKVYVKRNNTNSFAVDLHVLAKNENGFLTTASSTLKSNIKTYLTPYRMITDAVNILDSLIINLRLSFGIVVSPKFNRSEVLGKCLFLLKDYFDINKIQIGQPIIISDIASELQSMLGVVSVYKLDFINVFGTVDGLSYSSTRFSIVPRNNIIYCPENSIFEIKFPNTDITGAAK
jgi:hypothetical protein